MKKKNKKLLYQQKIVKNDNDIINEVKIKSEKGKKIIEDIWSTMMLISFSKKNLDFTQCFTLAAIEYLCSSNEIESTCISEEDLFQFLTDIHNYKLSEL